MPELVLDIKDESQFSNGERTFYEQMKECLNAIGPQDIPDLALENFEVVKLKPARSTYLQQSIVDNVLTPMHRLAKCWDIDAAFHGYYGIHRTLQRHYLAINLALKKLHGDGARKKAQHADEEEKVEEVVEDPSPLFFQLMDFELLVSLRAMSQAGVLSYKVLQFVVEVNANYQALIRRVEQDGKWRLNPFYHPDAFIEDKDAAEEQLEDAEVRNQKLRASLNTAIENNEGLERRIVALTLEVERLTLEARQYKDKKPGLVKKAMKEGAAIVHNGAAMVQNGLFGSKGKPKGQGKSKEHDGPTYEAMNLG